jgi:hypothetical protein
VSRKSKENSNEDDKEELDKPDYNEDHLEGEKK